MGSSGSDDSRGRVYVPTGFERYTAVYEVGSQRINFTVWDTAGSSAYDLVRPLAYQNAKVFLLCFRINNQQSLQNAVHKWLPEVLQHAPNVPTVLCGCQSDTRTSSVTAESTATKTARGNPSEQITNLVNATLHRPIVSPQMAVDTAHRMGASTYVETSSKTSNVGSGCKTARDAFEVAALVALGRLNKNHVIDRTTSPTTAISSTAMVTSPSTMSTLSRDLSFETARSTLRSKSRLDIKSELKDRTKSCVLM